jgi:LacI family transcriptional regulator
MNGSLVRIGLVIEYSLDFYRQIVYGVKTYATNRPDWILTPIATERKAVELAKSLDCDGFIAHIFNRPLGLALKKLRRPVINVSGVLPDLAFPRVITDHAQVGRLAAEHLISRGLTRLAFVGYRTHEFSTERERGLREVARQSGIPVHSFHELNRRLKDFTGVWRWNDPLFNWLKTLEKPIGIVSSHDIQGAQIAEYCHQLGIIVPDEVAIVGADDDDLLCELSRPSLTSVKLPAKRIGFEAAAMLDRWINGEAPASRQIVLPPVGVIVRQSSNLQAVSDSELSAAVRFIHDHAHQPINVADLLRTVPIARRALERRFRKYLNRSVLEEIRRTHVERAKHLLLTTDLAMSEIAVRAGLTDSRHLSIAFRKVTGMTPSRFRSQAKVSGERDR